MTSCGLSVAQPGNARPASGNRPAGKSTRRCRRLVTGKWRKTALGMQRFRRPDPAPSTSRRYHHGGPKGRAHQSFRPAQRRGGRHANPAADLDEMLRWLMDPVQRDGVGPLDPCLRISARGRSIRRTTSRIVEVRGEAWYRLQVRAMLWHMAVWFTLLLGLVLLLVSKGYGWGIAWIDFLERLDSFRARRRLRVRPADPALDVRAESRARQCVPGARH
ncbi:MAG: hypothetical protein QOJ63_2995 [Solirubrobacteraceae bacterium]|nr:hypothetical protein [Solirubrobacteraceae bacterium]